MEGFHAVNPAVRGLERSDVRKPGARRSDGLDVGLVRTNPNAGCEVIGLISTRGGTTSCTLRRRTDSAYEAATGRRVIGEGTSPSSTMRDVWLHLRVRNRTAEISAFVYGISGSS